MQKRNLFSKSALGLLAGGMFAASSASAIVIDLPGTVSGDTPPVDLLQMNSIANFDNDGIWPIFLAAGGALGTAGTERMFWDVQTLTDITFADIQVPGSSDAPRNSHFYLDFNIGLSFTSAVIDTTGNIPQTARWDYTGGSIQFCQDNDGTSAGLGSGHQCDVTLMSMTVTGGSGGFNLGTIQGIGSLTVDAIVDAAPAQDPNLFDPDAARSVSLTSIFSTLPGFIQGQETLFLQTVSGATPQPQTNQNTLFLPAPEPTTVALLGLGLVGLGFGARRRKK
jgi:hypothetical protein